MVTARHHLPHASIQPILCAMTPSTLTPQAFVDKWRHATLKERSAYQEHFIDLCRLIGHPTPAEADPTGENFAFEYGATKTTGGQGFADVFKRHCFAWEYKGKHADLDKAYQQLLQYREALDNPPLLVVCDIERIVIHTNFTNTHKRMRTLTLDDLLTAEGRKALKAVFETPAFFEQKELPKQVTQQAADRFATLAEHLRTTLPDTSPQTIAHLLIRCLFCLFAEDVELLTNNLFTRLVAQGRVKPEAFAPQLRNLFAAMASGGYFGVDEVRRFNGGLFNDDAVLPLDRDAIEILANVVALDWSNIEPSIFGELFVRGLDPDQRSKLGAQYTDRSDIELIVEPVLMAPLRRKWIEIEQQARELAAQRDAASGQRRAKLDKQVRDLLQDFAAELKQLRVLDAACGSGNFLYVSLVMLLDLWQAVAQVFAELTLQHLSPLEAPSPLQLRGIEINEYARELAQATIWIGYIQWHVNNGYGFPDEPILKPIDSIEQRDAILNPDGTEPDWPDAEIIVGNPPFLGGGKIRSELGDEYTEALFKLYGDRLPNFSDLVCYWFEKARAMVEAGKTKRVGLLATNSIRGGANREVLKRIKGSGDLFWAQSDRDWVLEGAAVRVSMVGFSREKQKQSELDGQIVAAINSDLTATVDLTTAKTLIENMNICFQGPSAKAPFDIESDIAHKMLSAPRNPNGRQNSDVVRPLISAIDLTQGSRNMWTIDFGLMREDEAALYEIPFEYLKKNVYPIRSKNRRASYAAKWWQYAEARPGMRAALKGKPRYIATPAHSKHRVFVWIMPEVLCNQATLVFARDDDYFFGVLHSRVHEIWSLRQGTSLEDRPRYTPTTSFETFPFPWPPGQEPSRGEAVAPERQSIGNADMAGKSIDSKVLATASPLQRERAIAEAARELVQLREAWLNPDPHSQPLSLQGREERVPSPSQGEGQGEGKTKPRTLTNLYNQRPTWLDNAHRKLDEAVFAAYGWPSDLSDDEILARLLELNLARAT
jgi:type II restriction/modification system DNA methylase subunit YeeA